MTTTAYMFIVEQFNPDRCKSTIRREIRFNTEEEAMKAFDGYDVETEFRAFLKTEGRASMEGSFLEAIVIPATTDDDGWTVYDYEEEVGSKTYSWEQYVIEH